jgi:Spy/CpxP family protein refolding chaperone
MRSAWKLLLVLSLSLNVGILGVGIYRSVASLEDLEPASGAPENVAEEEPASTQQQPREEQQPASEQQPGQPPATSATAEPGRRPAFAPRFALRRPLWAAAAWPERHLRRLDRALGLRPEQHDALRETLAELRPRVRTLAVELARERAELVRQLAASPPDVDAVRAQQARASHAQAQLDSLVTEAMLRESSVLDPEQRRLHARLLRAMAIRGAGLFIRGGP